MGVDRSILTRISNTFMTGVSKASPSTSVFE